MSEEKFEPFKRKSNRGRKARECPLVYIGYTIDKRLKEAFDKLGKRRRVALEYAIADYIGYPRSEIGKRVKTPRKETKPSRESIEKEIRDKLSTELPEDV